MPELLEDLERIATAGHPRGLAPLRTRAGTGRPPDDPKNPTVNFNGEARRNDTHHSITDPDARLYKKAAGREAKLGYLGHLLTENRHGFIVDTAVTAATGTAERDAAIVRLIRTLLFGVTPTDPAVFGFTLIVIIGVGLAGALVPACRASALDPMATLRTE